MRRSSSKIFSLLWLRGLLVALGWTVPANSFRRSRVLRRLWHGKIHTRYGHELLARAVWELKLLLRKVLLVLHLVLMWHVVLLLLLRLLLLRLHVRLDWSSNLLLLNLLGLLLPLHPLLLLALAPARLDLAVPSL